MQCSCGADAALKQQPKSRRVKLTFYQCAECGRVSDGILYVDDTEVLRDAAATPHARIAYVNLGTDDIDRLYREAMSSRGQPDAPAASDAPEQPPKAPPLISAPEHQQGFDF